MNRTVWDSLAALDDALRGSRYFDYGYRLTYKRTARGEVYWQNESGDFEPITVDDTNGPYFYIRANGPLRVNLDERDTTCGGELELTFPVVVVAWVEKHLNPFCVHAELSSIIDSVSRVTVRETEVDTLRVFWNEMDSARLDQEQDAPVNVHMHALSWTLDVKVDLSVDRCEDDSCCEPIDYCTKIDRNEKDES